MACGAAINEHLQPIIKRRWELERKPDLVVDVLQTGAAKARAAAEQIMGTVREAIGYGGSLRDVRISAPAYLQTAAPQSYDLKDHGDWWSIEDDALRSRILRDWFFREVLPTDITLREDSPRVYITKHNKRVYVTTARATVPGHFFFTAKPKSYDLLCLLCWGRNMVMRIFVVPQKLYVDAWTMEKHAAGKRDIEFSVRPVDESYLLKIGPTEIDITEFGSSYQALH